MAQKSHLSTLLVLTIMMILDNYVYGFLQWLGMLNVSIIIRQCLLSFIDKMLLKTYPEICEKISSLMNK